MRRSFPTVAMFLAPGLVNGCAGRAARMDAEGAVQAAIVDSLPAVGLDLTRGWADPGVRELARAIGDARVIMLGEPWHGDGGAIRLRAELVKLLHQHLGFDVLAFEADFYSLYR